jgi:hypothetical protein
MEIQDIAEILVLSSVAVSTSACLFTAFEEAMHSGSCIMSGVFFLDQVNECG